MTCLKCIIALFFLSPYWVFSQDGWYAEGDFNPEVPIRVEVKNTLNSRREDCPITIYRDQLPIVDLSETWVTVVDPVLPPQGWSNGYINSSREEFHVYVLQAEKEYNNPARIKLSKTEFKELTFIQV